MKTKYIVALVLGNLLTIVSSNLAFNSRGYWAVGGEWFIIPLLLLATNFVPKIFIEIKNIKSEAE